MDTNEPNISHFYNGRGDGKVLFTFILTLILLLPAVAVRADDLPSKPYCSYDEQSGTVTLGYGTEIPQGSDEITLNDNMVWVGENVCGNSQVNKVVITASFFDFTPTSTARWFFGCSNLSEIDGLNYLNTSDVTDMNSMFSGCYSLASLDLSGFNTEKVTDMSAMFDGCSGIRTFDLSSFHTENVLSMDGMFFNYFCNPEIIYITYDWIIAPSHNGMFCQENPDIFILHDKETRSIVSLDIKTQPKQKKYALGEQLKIDNDARFVVTFDDGSEIYPMLKCAQISGYEPFNLGEQSITAIYNNESFTFAVEVTKSAAPYSFLDNETGELSIFYDTYRDGSKFIEVGGGKLCDNNVSVNKVIFESSFASFYPTSCKEWFRGFSNLTEIVNLEYLNTEEVTNMESMFSSCEKLNNIDLTHFNTSNVTNMRSMFACCFELGSVLDISSFDTRNVTNMEVMFEGCEFVTTIIVGDNWSTEKLDKSSCSAMFHFCPVYGYLGTFNFDPNIKLSEYELARIDGGESQPGLLTPKDAQPYNPMAYAVFNEGTLTFFYGEEKPDNTQFYHIGVYGNVAEKINKVVFDPSFKLYYPTRFDDGFFDLKNLSEIVDMDKYFNTGNMTNMDGMFHGCKNLQVLDLSSFDTRQVTSMESMFSGCENLETIYVGDNWSIDILTHSGGEDMFYNCTSLIGGKGTTYDANFTDHTYARIDDPENGKPGYFTYKASTQEDKREAYAVFDNGTLTFYYDENKPEGAYGMRTSNQDGWSDVAKDITKVVFHKSFADYYPTSCSLWFCNCQNLTEISGSEENLNTENVTNMGSMFSGCRNLTTLDLSNFNTMNVRDMSGMFFRCSSLKTIYVSDKWSTALVETQHGTFDGCEVLYGEKGTECVPGKTDASFATVDGGISAPGYCTLKGHEPYIPPQRTGVQAYAVFDKGTLTLRYDDEYTDGVYFCSKWYTSWESFSNDITQVVFDESFGKFRPVSLTDWFNRCINLSEIVDMDKYLNTEDVTDMSYMFSGCSNLTTLNISNFNTEKVTDMRGMFYGCSSLTTLDVSNFNTEKVTDMEFMFGGCKSLTTLDVSNFNTEKVTDMEFMFNGCSGLKTIYVGDKWSTKSVLTSKAMFYDCTNLVGEKGTKWERNHVDQINATYARIDDPENGNPGYFTYKASAQEDNREAYAVFDESEGTLTFYYDGNKPEGAFGMRTDGSDGWSNIIHDINKVVFNESFSDYRPTSCAGWFSFCRNLTTIEGIEYLNTENVTDMTTMFLICESLTTLDLSSFNAANVTVMGEMFAGCHSLITLDISSFNAANVTNMSGMFSNCKNLKTIYVSGKWSTKSLVETSVDMFDGCEVLYGEKGTECVPGKTDASFAIVDGGISAPGYFTLKGHEPFTPQKTGDQAYAVFDKGTLTFRYDDKYTEGVYFWPKFDTPWESVLNDITKVVFDESFGNFKPDRLSLFTNCYFLTEIVGMDKYLNTENVTDMGGMFLGCGSLSTLDLSSFDTEKVTDMVQMFFGCNSLKTIYVGDTWSTNSVDFSNDMFGNCTALVGGKGTTYDENHIDITYARIDGGEKNPGYFTIKEVVTPIDTVFTAPTKLSYIEGEELDLTGGKITIVYSDETSEDIALNNADVTLSAFDNTAIGEQVITVKYKGVEIGSFTVTVKAKSTDKEAYAVFDDKTSTLTFYYDGNKPEGAYGMRTEEDNEWSKVSDQITKVVFDESFADYRPSSCAYWFYKLENLTEISGMKEYLNTSEVTSMHRMFSICRKLSNIDVSGFNTENVVDMGCMFFRCHSLTSLNVSNFNTENVTDMSGMFDACPLSTLDVSKFNTEKVESMSSMFANCDELADIDVSNFNTENVVEMRMMFFSCGLTSLDISNFNTGKVQLMEDMFMKCHKLQTIYVGNNWSTNAVTSSEGMFEECTTLVGGNGTTYDANFTDHTYARVDDPENGKPGYFTYKGVEVKPVDTVFTAPTKLSYIEGDELDLTGGKITIVYSDETTEDIALTNADVTISAFDNTKLGEQVVTITYKGIKIGSFTVTVNAKPEPQPENPYTKPEVVDNVYQISSASELLYFMFDVNNGNVSANAVLLNDIVVNADLLKQIADLLKSTSKAAPVLTEWQPIGTAKNAYRGTFDGNGHTISGIYIKDETQNNVGLFGNVAKDAVIKNLGVTDSYIAGNENVGAICGKSEGTVVNCYTISEVKGSKNVNALVGAKETAAVVENCYYLAETPIANDPCAKTAEDFKSGDVAKLLAKGATINGVTYSGETFAGVTELPGTDIIPQPENNDNPSTSISSISENNVKVWSFNSTIYIETLPDTKYTIIDLNGRTIKSATTTSTKEEINLPKSGVFVVVINGKSYKIAL